MSSDLPLRIGISRVAQTVAQKVQRQYRDDHASAGPEQPGCSRNRPDILCFLKQHTPAYHRRAQPNAEETERGFGDNHAGDRQRDHSDNMAEARRNHVAEDDTQWAATIKPRGLDKILGLQGIKLTSDDSCQPCPAEDGQDNGDEKIDLQGRYIYRDSRCQSDPQWDGGDGLQKLNEPLNDVVNPPAKIARYSAQQDAKEQAEAHAHQPDSHRHTRTINGS